MESRNRERLEELAKDGVLVLAMGMGVGQAQWLQGAIRSILEELDTLKGLCDDLRQQGAIWKQEARTQTATVNEIYQLVTGATGEPGNWNGAEPVRALLAENAKLRKVAELAKEAVGPACGYVTAKRLHRELVEALKEAGALKRAMLRAYRASRCTALVHVGPPAGEAGS